LLVNLVYFSLLFSFLPFSFFFKQKQVRTGPGNSGKSWKSVNCCKKVAAVLFLDLYFVRVYYFNYCAFGRPGKIYLSPSDVLEKAWKIVSEKGYEP